MYLHYSDASLQSNTISGNNEDTYGYGGGLYLYKSDATLSHNDIEFAPLRKPDRKPGSARAVKRRRLKSVVR